MKSFYLAFFGIALCSCGRGDNAAVSMDDVADSIDIEQIEILRFDRAVERYAEMDSAQRDSIVAVYSPVIAVYEQIEGVDDADGLMRAMASSRVHGVFYPDVEERLGALDSIEMELGRGAENLKAALPGVSLPVVYYGAIVPYNQSVVIADSIVVIGLNHYLGEDYEGYGGFDIFRRRLKTKNRMAMDVLESVMRLQREGAMTDDNRSLASAMIYEGAIVEALHKAMPWMKDADLLGYSNEQLAWAQANEAMVWNKIVSDQLLYGVDPSMIDKMVGMAPYSAFFGSESAPRVGRYIGWKIVRGILERNKNVKLSDLLRVDAESAPELLLKSGYSGGK